MILANRSEAELRALLVASVDVWQPENAPTSNSGKLNAVEIFRHWRGRPSESDQSMITMLECARVAWRRAKTSASAFDELIKEGRRLLELDISGNHDVSQESWIVYSFQLAKAIAHVCMAASYWSNQDTHTAAVTHLSQAAQLYEQWWSLGLQPHVDFSPFDMFASNLPDLHDKLKSILALMYRTFGPLNLNAIPITGTTYLILYELLCAIMNHRRKGTSRTTMQGLFIGPDDHDPEHEMGHVLEITVRRLRAPVQSFYLDPLSLGVTLIDQAMRDSLRAAWRCCLYDLPSDANSKPFSLRIEVELPNPQVGLLTGGSAGGLLAAMMCAARDEIELSSNLSATCSLDLTKEEQACVDSTALDPHQVKLGPIHGVVAKLRDAWLEHGVDEVYVHQKNYEEWKRARYSGPRANKADNLAELIDKLNRDQPLWEELENATKVGYARWDEIIASQGKPRGGRDQHHRLDLYVEPMLRIEGEPRPYDEEGITHQTTIQSLLVPGDELTDQPLVNVLALALGDGTEVDWDQWIPKGDASDEADDAGVTGEDELDSLDSGAHAQNVQEKKSPSERAVPAWLSAGCDLLIYDAAGAGKSVLTLRIERLLNDAKLWPAIFDSKQPPLVLRVEGVWPQQHGQLLPLREMIYETIVRRLEHPNPQATHNLREEEKAKIRKTVEFVFAKRRLVLIVDGFDQFASTAREHIVSEHNTEDGRACRWVIASRQHTIATLFGTSQRSRDWMRVRIEPFNERQRDAFFKKAGLADVWQRYVNPESEAMAEMLRLPVVLDQIREFIKNRIEVAKKSGLQPEPVEFESLSQLALVTSRLSLERALDPERLADLTPPEHLKLYPNEQLNEVEHVLSLVAFQLLLQSHGESDDAWNGLVRGKKKKEAFLTQCRVRYHHEVLTKRFQLKNKAVPQMEDDLLLDDLKRKSEKDGLTWDWAMSVLDKVELNHRTYMEQIGHDILAFRDRKAVEFYASRYLTRHATEWDIFADYPADKRTVASGDVTCAWQRIADPQWSNTWRLAIDMPQSPLPGTTEHTFSGAVLDPLASCLSLSALFRPTLDGSRRPTELLWRCWPLFEFDPRRALDARYRYRGRLMTGHELVNQGLTDEFHALGKRQLLSDQDDTQLVGQARERCLTMFRESSRDMVVKQIEARLPGVLLEDGTRHAIPADKRALEHLLGQWENQSAGEKSLTFLQCPPQAWLDAYESDPSAHADPRINPAIKGHESEALEPLLMQATPVTRGMFYEFDPHFDKGIAIAESLRHESWQDFPVVDASWFDAFVFCKWLGPEYRLPDDFEWELAARAGTQTEYHFGDRLSGDLANCDGNDPHPEEANHPSRDYLGACTPVGLNRYPCSSWGLWDIHGNVWEWCENHYDDDEEGSYRVRRGGSWVNSAGNCRSGFRNRYSPGFRYYNLGFRVALVPPSKSSQSKQQPPIT